VIGVARPQRTNFARLDVFVICWLGYWGWPVVVALVASKVLVQYAPFDFPGLALLWFVVILVGLVYLVHVRGRAPAWRPDWDSLNVLDEDFAKRVLHRKHLPQVWHAAKLTSPAGVDKQGRPLPDHTPLVDGVWSVPTGLVLQAQIVPGAQTTDLFVQRAPNLASAFGVDAVEVKRGRSSTEIELLLVRRDGLYGTRNVMLDDPADPSAPWGEQ